MMIAERIHGLRERLPAGVELVAVSKFHPVEQLGEAYAAGQRRFGESRVQELVAKVPQLPADVEWHFIGHLQKNKVRQLMPHVAMIQSIDSLELLHLVDKEAARLGRTVDVLLELHVAAEQAKSGFLPEEIVAIAERGELNQLSNTILRGVMAMATFTDDMAQVDREFAVVESTFNRLKKIIGLPSFNQVSMGMSDDWQVAIKHGSTMVRIGTEIFGPRVV